MVWNFVCFFVTWKLAIYPPILLFKLRYMSAIRSLMKWLKNKKKSLNGNGGWKYLVLFCVLFWRVIVFISSVKVFIYDNRSSFFSIDLIDICDLHPGNKEQHGTRFCGTVDYIEKVILGTLKNQKYIQYIFRSRVSQWTCCPSLSHSLNPLITQSRCNLL